MLSVRNVEWFFFFLRYDFFFFWFVYSFREIELLLRIESVYLREIV